MTEVHRKKQLGSLHITNIEYRDEESDRTDEIEIQKNRSSERLKIVEEDLDQIKKAVINLKEDDSQ